MSSRKTGSANSRAGLPPGLNFRQGRYMIDVTHRGRRYTERLGADIGPAVARLEEIRLQIRSGSFGFPERSRLRPTLSRMLGLWLEHRAEIGQADLRRERSIARVLAQGLGRDRPVRELQPGDVQDFIDGRLRGAVGDPVRPATVNRQLAVLKKACAWAVAQGFLLRNPCDQVVPLQVDNARDRVVSGKELELLLEAAAPHIRPVLQIAYWTALTRGELLSLDWRNVRREALRLGEDVAGRGRERSIPLFPAVRTALQGILATRRTRRRRQTPQEPRSRPGEGSDIPLKSGPERPEQGPVFDEQEGVFIQTSAPWPRRGAVFLYHGRRLRDFTTAFESARIRAGIEDLRVQDLRHSAIVNWRRAGVDLELCMEWAGLTSAAALSRYREYGSSDLELAIERVASSRTE